MGDYSRAASLYAGCLPHYKRLRSHWYLAHMLAALGAALGRLGQADTAATLFGAAEAQLELLGVGMHTLDRDMYQPGLDATQSQISPAAYESLRSAGRALTIDQALQIAETVRTGATASNS